MRVAAILVLIGCKQLPDPPDPERYRAMTPAERCEAVAERALRCADDLLIVEVKLAPGETTKEERERLERLFREHGRKMDAREIHREVCETAPGYTDAIIGCWRQPECHEFVECVQLKAGL